MSQFDVSQALLFIHLPPQCHLPSSESFIPKADPVAAIPPRDDVTSSAYVLGEFGLERSYSTPTVSVLSLQVHD